LKTCNPIITAEDEKFLEACKISIILTSFKHGYLSESDCHKLAKIFKKLGTIQRLIDWNKNNQLDNQK